MDESERLPGREYFLELKRVEKALVETFARLQALDLEEKPAELVGDLSLTELVDVVDRAIDLTKNAKTDAQMRLAIEGVVFEDED